MLNQLLLGQMFAMGWRSLKTCSIACDVVAGKTGTAEIDGKEDTSVFVAFGPNRGADQTPEYVVGAILEEAGFGADVAAPLVRRIMDPLRDRSSLPKAVAVDAYNPNPVEL